MLRQWRLLWRALLLLVPSAAAAQQPGSAGATRPRLEVLQALPEAQLFPLMNLVATSLGVGCEYCHVQANPDLARTPSNVGGWIWDRDDRGPKRQARDMMKMVVVLNASSFKGEARVTCYTCHRGTTRPSRLPPLPPAARSAGAPSPTLLPSADRVWAAYVAAVGRLEAAAPRTGIVVRGWDERSEGRYGKFEITVAGSDRYRLTLTTPEATTNQGQDGALAWTIANDRVQQFSTPADVARMRRIAMRYRPVKEQPADLRTVGIERVDDGVAYVLQGRIDSVTTQRAYFDVVTGLLRREITTTETLLIPLVTQVDYDDYRDVGGVQMPYRVRISDGAPYSTTTRMIMEIRRNVPVDDALFRPPG
jgi:hypothetical protein